MGLIKNIFGGIFSFLGGVFGGIAKLLGIGKKGEFYMELEGDAGTTAAKPVQPALSSQANPGEATPAQAPAPTAKTEKQPVPVPPQVASAPERPLVVPNPPAPSQTTAPVTNFATDYLVNRTLGSSSRRRPGPSITPFKDMAKQMGKQSPSMG